MFGKHQKVPNNSCPKTEKNCSSEQEIPRVQSTKKVPVNPKRGRMVGLAPFRARPALPRAPWPQQWNAPAPEGLVLMLLRLPAAQERAQELTAPPRKSTVTRE